MSSSGLERPRFVYPGAGSTLQFPLTDSSVSSSSDPFAQGVRLQDAYFVAPASHIGRIVTGVVFLAEQSRRVAGSSGDATDRFGLPVISFADKLAEQGYKVLVLDLFAPDGKAVLTASATLEHVARVQQASLYLKKTHDIQRVGVCGLGAGADLAIKLAIERSVPVDCVVAMCPRGLVPLACTDIGENAPTAESAGIPLLLQVGGKSPYAASEAYRTLLSLCAARSQAATTALKVSLFVNQQSGFAFSNIKDEDAATQAIAEMLDWLVQHLHRFKVAAATSDTDPWWPQGRNGPFCNVGLRTWQDSRVAWLTPTQTRPPRPPPVPAHLLFDGLSSVRRTFELPQRMRLGDVIELFAEIWDVQQ
ncbi:unnamed protein product [Hyaloperonospora brassicae]|uniref:Dienelactone hydrolase domain-containing protein n=1 Tax=Hyaloperonospora brassicae TaxID=162125 RepID=A0AAV0UT45_HYABA|nr:unnamed protein product [Hyaloperonospora brassicae]